MDSDDSSDDDAMDDVLCDTVHLEEALVVARALTRCDNPMGFFSEGERKASPGGLGTPRPNRAPPRQFKPDAATVTTRVMRPVHSAPWAQSYLAQPPQEASMAWDHFRLKFRVPWPMFNWLMDETWRSQIFPDELAPVTRGGRKPFPLGSRWQLVFAILPWGAKRRPWRKPPKMLVKHSRNS